MTCIIRFSRKGQKYFLLQAFCFIFKPSSTEPLAGSRFCFLLFPDTMMVFKQNQNLWPALKGLCMNYLNRNISTDFIGWIQTSYMFSYIVSHLRRDKMHNMRLQTWTVAMDITDVEMLTVNIRELTRMRTTTVTKTSSGCKLLTLVRQEWKSSWCDVV